jgi:predicted transcriptional regulator
MTQAELKQQQIAKSEALKPKPAKRPPVGGAKNGHPKNDPANVVGNPSRHAVRSPEVLEKVLQAVMLRKAGATYTNIAKNIGVDESTANRYVLDEMRRLNEEIQEGVKEHRQMQLERLNDMLLGYWPRRADPKFGGMILACMNKMDNLLGIVSEKIDLNIAQTTVEKLSEAELDKFLASKMSALQAPKKIVRE